MHCVWRDVPGDVNEEVKVDNSNNFRFGSPVRPALRVCARDAVRAVFFVFTMDAEKKLRRCLCMREKEPVESFACIGTGTRS